jgi:hypothetical protein|tara:strand:+ start:235 stop:501 length:267 start_codon:yes stop_codon:yes gene_type:complete
LAQHFLQIRPPPSILVTITVTNAKLNLSNSLKISSFTVSSSDDSSSFGSGVLVVVVGYSENIERSTDNGSSFDNVTSPSATTLMGVPF